MVKEEEATPLSKRTLGGKKYTNSELPSGALDNGVWRQVFIPTYMQYLANQDATILGASAIMMLYNSWNRFGNLSTALESHTASRLGGQSSFS
jgi:hypothetical protein